MSVVFANSDALTRAREAAGFSTTRKAAKASGVPGVLLARIERSSGRLVHYKHLEQLAALYGCTADSLTMTPHRRTDVELDPEAIQAARKALGWSVEDLAAHVGVTFSAMLRWENEPALRTFDFNRMKRVSRALGVPEEALTRAQVPTAPALAAPLQPEPTPV